MGDVQKTKLAALKPSGKRNLRLLPLLCSAFRSGRGDEQICDSDPLRTGHHATRSVDTPVIGLKELMVQHENAFVTG